MNLHVPFHECLLRPWNPEVNETRARSPHLVTQCEVCFNITLATVGRMSLRSSLKGDQFGDHCDMLAGGQGDERGLDGCCHAGGEGLVASGQILAVNGAPWTV